jgi:hypothetical protein
MNTVSTQVLLGETKFANRSRRQKVTPDARSIVRGISYLGPGHTIHDREFRGTSIHSVLPSVLKSSIACLLTANLIILTWWCHVGIVSMPRVNSTPAVNTELLVIF